MTPNRRQFLRTSAAAAATSAGFTIVAPRVLGGPRHVAPSDTVNVALVGAGGQGRSNLQGLYRLNDVRVVAVADPAERWDLGSFYYRGDAGRAPVAAEIEKQYAGKSPGFKCATYEDFRELLDKEKGVDAVLCATPDHLHAYVSVRCMRAGKHVYCEKPLTHDVAEARTVAKVAAETKLATQMGNQLHATPGLRQTVDWVRGGVIGRVKEVHAWVSTNRWNPTLQGKPAGTTPTPDGLNWDLWQGPREPRPFHQAYAPVAWRDFWSFGAGALGDFGCHDMDSAVWALDLDHPTRVDASHAGYMDAEIAPYGAVVRYQFPARDGRGPVTLTWYDGGLKPPVPEALGPNAVLPGRGALFVGETGVIYSPTSAPPKLLGRDGGTPEVKEGLPKSPGHHREWVDAIKGGTPAQSNFAYGARLTEIVQLGVVALRLGKPLLYDGAAMTARNAPEAAALLNQPRRKGWELA